VSWVWLNIPLMAVFFLAIAGIPLWLVFRHPDTAPAAARGVAAGQQPVLAAAAVTVRETQAREFAGAGR